MYKGKDLSRRGAESGDKCLLSTGEDVTIEKVEVESLTEAETTYNFEVADFHTYYVTEKDGLKSQKRDIWIETDYVLEELKKIFS